MTEAAHIGQMLNPVTRRPRLRGYCPDNNRCRFTQTPCLRQCSRLQASEITDGMQASAARTAQGSGSVDDTHDTEAAAA